MSPTMRAKLSRNIDYHVAMRDFYKDEDKKQKEAQEPQSEPPPTRGAAPKSEADALHEPAQQPPKPAQSAAEKLAEMHADVVEQLTAVVNAEPEINAVEQARLRLRPLRSPGANLKPTAGVFH